MRKVVYILALIFLSGCYDEIDLEKQEGASKLLVVSGRIDLNDDSIIKVSESYIPGEIYWEDYSGDEVIWIEDSNGKRYESTYTNTGYQFTTIGEDKSLDYKVHVEFVDGRKYESLPIQIYDAPSINTISFEEDRSKDKYQFYISFENKINESRYYRLKYSIKWKEIKSYGDVVDPEPRYYELHGSDCLRTDQYVVNGAKHIFLTLLKEDKKLKYEISFTASLIALSYDGFMYWNNARVNMSDLGTIYAPQPSEIKGNIICTSDPKVDALGFVSGGSISTFERTFYRADF